MIVRWRSPIVLALLLVACIGGTRSSAGRTAPPSTPTSIRSAIPTATPDSAASGERRVPLPNLPNQGIAVERRRGIELVALTGRVVARLDGFHLDFTWAVPGNVIVRQGERRYFVLRPDAHVLVPLPSRDRANALAPQYQPGFAPDADPGLPYPMGTRVKDHADLRSGWWTYALPSRDGTALLAQWSGECEAPNAFFVEGTNVTTADGFDRLGRAAESRALGWTRDGRAAAWIAGGPCGNASDRPGVYLLRGPGDGDLIVPGARAVRMWNPA